jgi:hypothetical protein
MRKIEDIYKNYNEKIIPSKNLDNKVFNETIYKRKINPFWKKAILTISIFLIVSITAIGIVFAKEIKEVIQKYFVVTITPHTSNENVIPKPRDIKMLEVHTFKEINYDALLPEVDEEKHDFDNKPRIKLGELEGKLETKFLHFKEDLNQKIIIYGVEKVDNKIGKVKFDTSIKANNKSIISIQMDFVTKYSKKDSFSIRFSRGIGITLQEHSNKLNTDIYYTVGTTIKEDYENRLTFNEAIFVYDDVAYHLSGNNITKKMLTELIESAIID